MVIPRKMFLFLKQGQKLCLNLLIKKKRIAQLINRKPNKNYYNKTIREQHLEYATSKPTIKQTYNRNLTIPKTPRRGEDPCNGRLTESSSLKKPPKLS
jgi:hypothetical protein